MSVCVCFRVGSCVWICALIRAHRRCRRGKYLQSGSCKKRPTQTRADVKWQLCISLTGTDSWQMDSSHTPQEKRHGEWGWMGGYGDTRRPKMEREREREKKKKKERHREKAPRMIRRHCSLFRGPTFDWVLQRIINPLLPCAMPAFLSFLISRFPLHFLSYPLSSLNSPLLSQTLLLLPLFCSCSFILRLIFPGPIFSTSWTIFMFSLPCSCLLSAAICHPGVFVSLYLRCERQG